MLKELHLTIQYFLKTEGKPFLLTCYANKIYLYQVLKTCLNFILRASLPVFSSFLFVLIGSVIFGRDLLYGGSMSPSDKFSHSASKLEEKKEV